MSADHVIQGYAAKAEQLGAMLGTSVAAGDPDRSVIESWASTVQGRILDVGSGTGRWSGHLAGLGHDVEGLEPVDRFLRTARATYPEVRFRQAAITDLIDSPQRWGGILAWYSLIHLGPEEMPEALQTLRGALLTSGTLLLSFFSGKQLRTVNHPAALAYSWPVQDMRDALEQAGFAVLSAAADDSAPHAVILARAVPTA